MPYSPLAKRTDQRIIFAMEPVVIALVVTSALFHALRDFLNKKSGDKLIFMWMFQIASTIYFLPLFVYSVYTHGFASAPAAWLPLLVSSIIHFFYWLFLSASLEHGDLSHVYPIARSAPAFVLLIAVVFLGERVSITGVIGILTVTLGVYVINLKSLNASELFAPIKAVLHEKAVRYALLTLLCVTAYSITDKIGVQHFQPIQFIYILILLMLLLYTPIILISKGKARIITEWNRSKKTVFINGFLVTGGYLLILIAFTLERVSYVVGLRQLSVLFAVLLGGHLLQEKQKGIRLFAALLIFIGSLLISVTG